ncbi:protein N-terminal glutamine amidohydrolase isoform X3 [Cryptomeria japonica]|uniref:protein N-terminal glutamine amidohydrolase isoform X3 n=1 Tax=Cryptomeria japonica TaxID=3369 RepID=UPI0025AB8DAA|nr:protein N-terminal glutamine amidohydrolase isoform X3 [Cryptomeria japonica]
MAISDSTAERECEGTSTSVIPSIQRSQFKYTSCYCEENVYMLCKSLCSAGVATSHGSDLFVVFISNENRQKSREKDAQVLVWDLDTMLPFPVPLHQYITDAIRPSLPLYPNFRRLFRVIHGPIFLCSFASDRRHMKSSEGNWIAPPPPYNCITAEDGTVHNLESFVSMSIENINQKMEEALTDVFKLQTGVVIDENKLEDFFMQIL